METTCKRIFSRQAGQNEEAEKYYRLAVKLRPNVSVCRSSSMVNISYVIKIVNKWVFSFLKTFGELFLTHGGIDCVFQEATSHMNLGAMLHVNGKLLEAEMSYLEALRLKPDDNITQNNLQKLRNLLSKRGIRTTHVPESQR